MTGRQLYLRLLGYVAPHWRIFLGAIIGMVVVAATEPGLPILMKPLLDGSFVERDPQVIRLIPVAIVGIFIIRGLGSFFGDLAIHWIGNRVVMELRNAMFDRLVTLPTRFYADQSTGNLISRVTYDAAQVTTAATTVLTVAVKDSLAIVGLLAWLLWLNWKLTLVAFAAGPALAVIFRVMSRRLRSMSRETQRTMGDMTAVVDESIGCHRVVKVFGGEDYERGRFNGASEAVRRFMMKQATSAAATVPMVQVLSAVVVAVIVYIAAVQSGTSQTTVGGFVSFITALLMLLAPLKRLSGLNEHLQRGLAAAESVFDLLDQEPEVDEGRAELPRARGRVELENVTFRYAPDSPPALDSVSLKVEPGETVALVGPSGSGKTTLVNLLPRLFDVREGRILLDGRDIREFRLKSLRANIALVSQDVLLFNDTVAANIAYGGRRGASREQVAAAAEAAHALEFILKLPEGLDTLVGENGVKLSGGQRQRLAIARALLKDAPVLILDEATSALDSESERHVQAALETLMKGRTTFVIAHRLSTVEGADRILVLDHGRIVEAGPHAELMARDGLYARLYRIQFQSENSPA